MQERTNTWMLISSAWLFFFTRDFTRLSTDGPVDLQYWLSEHDGWSQTDVLSHVHATPKINLTCRRGSDSFCLLLQAFNYLPPVFFIWHSIFFSLVFVLYSSSFLQWCSHINIQPIKEHIFFVSLLLAVGNKETVLACDVLPPE